MSERGHICSPCCPLWPGSDTLLAPELLSCTAKAAVWKRGAPKDGSQGTRAGLTESSVTVNLQCLRVTALDVPWGGHPQSLQGVTPWLCPSLLEVPVWKGEEHRGCFPPWKLSLVTKPRLTALCLRELSAFAQQRLESGPQALCWVTKCKPLC